MFTCFSLTYDTRVGEFIRFVRIWISFYVSGKEAAEKMMLELPRLPAQTGVYGNMMYGNLANISDEAVRQSVISDSRAAGHTGEDEC